VHTIVVLLRENQKKMWGRPLLVEECLKKQKTQFMQKPLPVQAGIRERGDQFSSRKKKAFKYCGLYRIIMGLPPTTSMRKTRIDRFVYFHKHSFYSEDRQGKRVQAGSCLIFSNSARFYLNYCDLSRGPGFAHGTNKGNVTHSACRFQGKSSQIQAVSGSLNP
jgi:hypothetical protein